PALPAADDRAARLRPQAPRALRLHPVQAQLALLARVGRVDPDRLRRRRRRLARRGPARTPRARRREAARRAPRPRRGGLQRLAVRPGRGPRLLAEPPRAPTSGRRRVRRGRRGGLAAADPARRCTGPRRPLALGRSMGQSRPVDPTELSVVASRGPAGPCETRVSGIASVPAVNRCSLTGAAWRRFAW